MKKIDKVIYREITSPAVISVVVLSFVVFTREFGRLSELLIQRSADTLTIIEVILSLLPGILIFTVPISFLIGTMIGFSRLSSDSEITAMRASGVSLFQLLRPVLKVASGVTALTLLLTFFLFPSGNRNLHELRQKIGLRPLSSEIKPRVFNEDFRGAVLYIEDQELRASSWKGVFLADTSESGEKRIILARRGYPIVSPDGQRLQLHFENGSIYKFDPLHPEKHSFSQFLTFDIPIRSTEPEPEISEPSRPREKFNGELLADMRSGDPARRRQALVELNFRAALPLAALIFGALGLTLGLISRRGGRGYGFIMGLSVSFLYYVLFVTGSELARDAVLPLPVGVWGADFLLAALALLSLAMQHRESHFFHQLAESGPLVRLAGAGRLALSLLSSVKNQVRGRFRNWFLGLPRIRFRLARVVDTYIVRQVAFYVLVTLFACGILFCLFTFFELIDDIFSNSISYTVVLDYFLYLIPHIVMMLVPISVLIGTLVTFGVLDRTNQIMALKSCGISIYRATVPVLSFSVLVCAFIFLLQEYVLPYANQRQDGLRNVIKGRPIQTFQPGRNWIFGEDHRLFNYKYFDSEHDVFADLSLYEIVIGQDRFIRHIYAQRALWQPASGTWRLRNGWVRDFKDPEHGFRTFGDRTLSIAETPAYFREEVKQSSKMTYQELKNYIEQVQQRGFEVDHLKTELYKKLSFPIVNVIMVILGIPFAFSVGKKGALYGVAAGVLIGIFYWGTFGVFGVLGSSGLLSPLLAAWGPDILFGAGSVLLLSAVKT